MSKKILPITPKEAEDQKIQDIPGEVIETWNKIIVKNLIHGTAIIYQKEIVNAISSAMNCDRDNVFNNKWLDIESLYRERGWHVEYDKPAYNEIPHEAFFTFKKKKG